MRPRPAPAAPARARCPGLEAERLDALPQQVGVGLADLGDHLAEERRAVPQRPARRRVEECLRLLDEPPPLRVERAAEAAAEADARDEHAQALGRLGRLLEQPRRLLHARQRLLEAAVALVDDGHEQAQLDRQPPVPCPARPTRARAPRPPRASSSRPSRWSVSASIRTGRSPACASAASAAGQAPPAGFPRRRWRCASWAVRSSQVSWSAIPRRFAFGVTPSRADSHSRAGGGSASSQRIAQVGLDALEPALRQRSADGWPRRRRW